MEALRDRHHLFFERHDYRQKPLAVLRRLVVADSVDRAWHKELHANVGPPPMPSRPLAHNILNHLEEHAYTQPLDNAFTTVDYLVKVGSPDTLAIAENLQAQLAYLVRGYDES